MTAIPLGWQHELVPLATTFEQRKSQQSWGNIYTAEEKNLITHRISLPQDFQRPTIRMHLSNAIPQIRQVNKHSTVKKQSPSSYWTYWEEFYTISYAGGRDEVFTHMIDLMLAVNLFHTEFTPRISVLHLHAGIGKYGQREGHRILYLIKNKWKQLQYNLK